jgi:hypothetical protein
MRAMQREGGEVFTRIASRVPLQDRFFITERGQKFCLWTSGLNVQDVANTSPRHAPKSA